MSLPEKNIHTEQLQQLVRECAVNDRKAQEVLYKQFYKPLLAICYRYVRNTEDAVEVLHTGFLKIFNHIHQFDFSRSALFTWMHQIMVNASIDFIRKSKQAVRNVEWTEKDDPVIEAEALTYRSAEEIMSCLKQLPFNTSTVFNLFVIEGYSHKEIANMLQISEGTSKWHLSEAKKLLTEIIRRKAIA